MKHHYDIIKADSADYPLEQLKAARFAKVMRYAPATDQLTAYDLYDGGVKIPYCHHVDIVALLIDVIDKDHSLALHSHVHNELRDHITVTKTTVPCDVQAALDEVVLYRKYLVRELNRLRHAAMLKINAIDEQQQYSVTDNLTSHTATCKGLESVLNRHYQHILTWWRSLFT